MRCSLGAYATGSNSCSLLMGYDAKAAPILLCLVFSLAPPQMFFLAAFVHPIWTISVNTNVIPWIIGAADRTTAAAAARLVPASSIFSPVFGFLFRLEFFADFDTAFVDDKTAALLLDCQRVVGFGLLVFAHCYSLQLPRQIALAGDLVGDDEIAAKAGDLHAACSAGSRFFACMPPRCIKRRIAVDREGISLSCCRRQSSSSVSSRRVNRICTDRNSSAIWVSPNALIPDRLDVLKATMQAC